MYYFATEFFFFYLVHRICVLSCFVALTQPQLLPNPVMLLIQWHYQMTMKKFQMLL